MQLYPIQMDSELLRDHGFNFDNIEDLLDYAHNVADSLEFGIIAPDREHKIEDLCVLIRSISIGGIE